MNKPFKFKQFTINQDQCAMKIGTDAVLLGALAPISHNPFSVLDIGAGTGILSLMLAQRSNTQVIDALEIDDDAYEQCVDNFEQSSWGDRLFCYHASLEEFNEEIEDVYDLIICNPPFYSEDFKTESVSRDIARFQDAMPFDQLVVSVAQLLSENGIFSVILPFKEKDAFIALAEHQKLKANKITAIKGNPNSKFKRVVIDFSFRESDITQNELIIETDRHLYTDDYINLTKDFYLKM
jgi:tRNA1Val (adenine37-N6)-methyltransferase